MRTVAAAATLVLVGCSSTPQAVPDPEFEAVLRRGGAIIDGILAVDGIVSPASDPEPARSAYARLLRTVEEGVRKRCGAQARRAPPDKVARAVLGVLKLEGYRALDLMPERHASELDPSLVSYAILHRRATCCSLTMLALALLESLGVEAYGVCMPDHTFIRVRGAAGEVGVETTTFGEAGEDYPADYLEKLRSTGGAHYLRSHDRRQALWHYFADCLWRWAFRRGKEGYVLPMLQRARDILGGTCRSMEFLDAKVNLFVGKEPAGFKVADGEALVRAERAFSRLFEWDVAEDDAALGLALIYKCRGDAPSMLKVLKRYVESNDLDRDNRSMLLYELWYLTRAEEDVEGYRLTPEQAEEALVFFEFFAPRERWTEQELRALERLKRIAGR